MKQKIYDVLFKNLQTLVDAYPDKDGALLRIDKTVNELEDLFKIISNQNATAKADNRKKSKVKHDNGEGFAYGYKD